MSTEGGSIFNLSFARVILKKFFVKIIIALFLAFDLLEFFICQLEMGWKVLTVPRVAAFIMIMLMWLWFQFVLVLNLFLLVFLVYLLKLF
jgi:hypothetical protein